MIDQKAEGKNRWGFIAVFPGLNLTVCLGVAVVLRLFMSFTGPPFDMNWKECNACVFGWRCRTKCSSLW